MVFNLKNGGNALKSGQIFKGDRILAVNSVSVLEKDEKEVYDLMLGPRGTRVTLTIRYGMLLRVSDRAGLAMGSCKQLRVADTAVPRRLATHRCMYK